MIQKNAVILKLCGGLGNQMFQYAAAHTLAKHKGVPLYIETSRYIATDFAVENEIQHLVPDYQELPDTLLVKIARLSFLPIFLKRFFRRVDWWLDMQTKNVYIEKDSLIYDPDFFKVTTPVILSGYFISEKYFLDNKNHMIDVFSNVPLGGNAKKIADKITACKTSISLHYRDFLDADMGSVEHAEKSGSLSWDFYDNAIQKIINDKKINPKYITIFVFSYNIETAKEFFNGHPMFENLVFVSYEEQYIWEDMKLMSLCDHNVVSNSTYAWWGAYLNQNPNTMVCYHKTYGKRFLGVAKHDRIPADWTAVL